MRWDELTANDFAEAVQETGVCVLAVGVLERHGEHLPLGTDYLNGHRLACLAAEKEPAIVFPPFYFGQIYEARCFPGAVTLKPTLLIELFESVLDEIARNGLHKIILYSAHGGNHYLVGFLAQCTLSEQKPYSLYIPQPLLNAERAAKWRSLLETPNHGHACECETSISLANHPHLVKMDRVPARGGDALRRLEHLPPTQTGIGWYSNYPEHYAGDARPATAEKGAALQQLQVDALAAYIAAVKTDKAVPALDSEFFARASQVGG